MRWLGLLLGFLADRVCGDPARWHPVAGFGWLAGRLERVLYADSRRAGCTLACTLVTLCALVGRSFERRTAQVRGFGAVGTAAATWVVLGGRSLEREALAVAELLEADDLPAARQRLTHLVGRDTSRLDEAEVARAVVESVAENTSDAVVAPLVWGALLGVPGLLAYRAANTLDAMVGHRTERYREFGWASARLDDVLNLPGSRLTATLVVLLGDDPRGAWRAWRRDARLHPSPNAGPVEAAFAGALGVRLGGRNVYASGVEDRAVLGDGRAPAREDVRRATALAWRVDVAAVLTCAAIAARRRRR
ncbi:cobalamin biosynthesis protein [Nocardioides mangrovicus]|uniref:Cobalamin biosynthesis protein CobD n=1 Tax=Nocardioides mangrovicus TaxID=2478913 RepID=A0A3L8P7N1_9ACTN|nr:cobalamin biosynthesis protein [Nocardioides mangrovicus]RLV50378.1 cobalamin biosynthesis protein [Nocardioides mangrovicus]